ncbi:hypothetical protein DPMN_055877 [Dreissena polymorpha]|uniref:Uncharacterized protein n=1 Tax=Dreissena polymorpha TaxID=45954 RepID=A0A9D4CSE0_DREPO|nr:hypothetical protein DPMN_055877 [Dreissena polymorpha]
MMLPAILLLYCSLRLFTKIVDFSVLTSIPYAPALLESIGEVLEFNASPPNIICESHDRNGYTNNGVDGVVVFLGLRHYILNEKVKQDG